MWKGESDLATLTAGIDPESAALVRLILHADDDCYVQQHRTACDERDLAYADPAIGRAANAISEGVPETTTNATQEHVIEMFEIVQAMAVEGDGAAAMAAADLRPMEWLRLQRCAKALPHQAEQLGPLDPAAFPELAQRPTLQTFLGWAKLKEYQQGLRESLGLRLCDIPFVQPSELAGGGLVKGECCIGFQQQQQQPAPLSFSFSFSSPASTRSDSLVR